MTVAGVDGEAIADDYGVAVAGLAGKSVVAEVMLPLIATRMECDLVKARIDHAAAAVAKECGTAIDYRVGTMMELPRAALAMRLKRL